MNNIIHYIHFKLKIVEVVIKNKFLFANENNLCSTQPKKIQPMISSKFTEVSKKIFKEMVFNEKLF